MRVYFSPRRAAGAIAAAALLWISAPSAFGLAVFNNTFGLPAGLSNGIVRIRETTANGNFVGTGTVIDITPDGSGGNWYCVLTADHVLRNPTNGAVATTVSMGFRFDQLFPYTIAAAQIPAQTRLDAPVDLAVFGIDIKPTDPAPPSVLPATVIAANTAAGNQIIHAGYGDQGTAGTGAPAPAGQDRYAVTHTFGTLLTGTNTITGTTANIAGPGIGNGNNYSFNSLDGTFAFTKDGAGNITSGTSYILSGDSGGPTFESNGSGGLGLVGVHSFSQGHNIGLATEYNIPGDLWHDVSANDYSAWIEQSCAMVVPEPSMLSCAMIVTMSVLTRRRRGTAI